MSELLTVDHWVVLYSSEQYTNDYLLQKAKEITDSHLLLEPEKNIRLKAIEQAMKIKATIVCEQCGCHEHNACFHEDLGPCWWVSDNLCSHCVPVPGTGKKYGQCTIEEIPADFKPEGV